MSKEKYDKRNIKQYALDILDIAQINLRLSIMDLNYDEIHNKINSNVNSIARIFCHCVAHIDWVFGGLCRGDTIFPGPQGFFSTKNTKDEPIPFTFKEGVESFLKIIDNTFEFLKKLPEENLRRIPNNPRILKKGLEGRETILQLIQRISLHFLGHVGEIKIIRNQLQNPSVWFVKGVSKPSRRDNLKKWNEWWRENQDTFK